MLPGRTARHLALTMLVSDGLLMMAGATRLAAGAERWAPVPVLDRGRMGHTVARPGGQRAYRAEGAARAISILDSRTGALLKTIPTSFRVDLLAISEDNRWLYGMSPHADAIIVIDLRTDYVVGAIPIRPPPPPRREAL